MEDKFLQSIKNSLKKIPRADLHSMSKEELLDYIEKEGSQKEQLLFFIKTVYIATQQSFYDSYQEGSDINFNILEGKLNYNPKTEIFIFTPNATVKKLLSNVEEKNTTHLKDVLSSRFYKILENLYIHEICGKKNKK